MLIVFIKYNPLYEVKLNGETIGYVKNKQAMEELINCKVLTSDNECAVFTTLNAPLTYELKLSSNKETDEQEIINILAENATTTYKSICNSSKQQNKNICKHFWTKLKASFQI